MTPTPENEFRDPEFVNVAPVTDPKVVAGLLTAFAERPAPEPEKPKVVAAKEFRNERGEVVENLFIFHTREMITEWLDERALKNVHKVAPAEELEQYSPVLRAVLGLDGVCEVSLQPYSMVVRKATLYSWKELAPRIMEILLQWHNTQVALRNGWVVGPGETPHETREVHALPQARPVPAQFQKQGGNIGNSLN